MCGIFGTINNKNVTNELINGLKYLEYRGYDSSGIALINKNNKFEIVKKVGKINELEKSVSKINGNIGIAHSRWATHGKPTELNAHPHLSCDGTIAVVHNGIIENYKELKIKLSKLKYKFSSETDTEVISNLLSYNLKKEKTNKDAILKTLKELKGSFGLAILFLNDKDHIYCARRGSPLLLGIGKNRNFVASGLSAFTGLTNNVIYLQEDDMAILSMKDYKIYDKNGKLVKRKEEKVNIDNINADKGKFEHFMLKEIYEEPKVIEQTINEYIDKKNKKIILPNFKFDLAKIDRLNIISCGTSYYASFIAKYFIEKIAKIKVDIDIASEFRYKEVFFGKNEICMFISQSGETADTIGALKICKEKKQHIISIVNVLQSNIAFLSDIVLKTMAGTEVGVASTKATIGQILVLYLFGLEIALLKKRISKSEYTKYINELIEFPKIINSFLNNKNNITNIDKIVKKVKKANYLLFIGRNIYYPVSLEGSLKTKELSYIPCEGIASGEFKHGPIALIDKNTYIYVINPSGNFFDKTSSNMEEIIAREGNVILISDANGIKKLKNLKIFENIEIPNHTNILLSAIISLVPIQLIAYYTAKEKGYNIDKPRNLAKSVTVE